MVTNHVPIVGRILSKHPRNDRYGWPANFDQFAGQFFWVNRDQWPILEEHLPSKQQAVALGEGVEHDVWVIWRRQEVQLDFKPSERACDR